MEKIVQAVVQDQQGRFGVIMDREGIAKLPTCMIDVGASFGKATMLLEAPVLVDPVMHLGFDPLVAEHYYLCEAKQADDSLAFQWMTAGKILQQPVHPSFGPVRNYLQLMAATREVA